MRKALITAALALAGCDTVVATPDAVESSPRGSSAPTTWSVFNLYGTTYRHVYLSNYGQIEISAEQGSIRLTRGSTTYVSNGYGDIHRGNLPPGLYTIRLTGTSGRAVIGSDVYGQRVTRQVADGVTWTREIDNYPATSINMLRVDTSRLADVDVFDYGTRCRSIPYLAGKAGATAGINGTFSQVTGSTCLQHAGAIRYGTYAYGDMGGERPVMSFPSADMEMLDDILDAEGPSALSGSDRLLPTQSRPGYPGSHPRTIIGTFPDGALGMMTIDGRTPAGTSVTLDEAADIAAEWGMVEAMNLDGGGSTTMVIPGATLNGVVNYPSDGHVSGYPDHHGARLVSDAVFVW